MTKIYTVTQTLRWNSLVGYEKHDYPLWFKKWGWQASEEVGVFTYSSTEKTFVDIAEFMSKQKFGKLRYINKYERSVLEIAL
jgi:hypothetical protein